MTAPTILPDGFRSSKDELAVKCSCKAQEGYLFPMNSAFMFIPKPVTYLKHSNIASVQLSRIVDSQSKTFDLSLETKDETLLNLQGIDKTELNFLFKYLKEKNIRVRNMDDGGRVIDLSKADDLTALNPARRPKYNDVEMSVDGEDEEMDSEDEEFSDDSKIQDDDDVSFDEESESEK